MDPLQVLQGLLFDSQTKCVKLNQQIGVAKAWACSLRAAAAQVATAQSQPYARFGPRSPRPTFGFMEPLSPPPPQTPRACTPAMLPLLHNTDTMCTWSSTHVPTVRPMTPPFLPPPPLPSHVAVDHCTRSPHRLRKHDIPRACEPNAV
jgi:hypothetical protein